MTLLVSFVAGFIAGTVVGVAFGLFGRHVLNTWWL
jgi:hypothetical protein